MKQRLNLAHLLSLAIAGVFSVLFSVAVNAQDGR